MKVTFALTAALLGAGGVVFGAMASRFLKPPLSRLQIELVERSPLLCATAQSRQFHLINENWLHRVDINEIGSSCGCVEVAEFSPVVGAMDTGLIELAVTPGPYEAHVNVTLTLVGTEGNPHQFHFEETVIPPFNGWPRTALGESAPNGVELKLDRRYENSFGKAMLFGKNGEQTEMIFDSDRALL